MRQRTRCTMAFACVVIIAFVVIFSAQLSLALGISYDYLEDKTLPLAPGATHYFKLNIQNEQEQPVAVVVRLESDIATLEGDSELSIPAKTYDRFVYFKIVVPQDAKDGARYQVGFSVEPAPARGEGQVPFNVKYERGIDVLVKSDAVATSSPADIALVARAQEERPAGFGSFLWTALANGYLTIMLGIIIAALLIFVWRRSSLAAHRIAPGNGAVAASSAAIPTGSSMSDASTAVASPSAATGPMGAATVPAVVAGSAPVVGSAMAVDHSLQISREDALDSALAEIISPKESAIDRVAPQGQEFVLLDGRRLASIRQLRDALRGMDDGVFHHHVRSDKNDFARWIADVFHEQAIADAVGRSTDKVIMGVIIDGARR